jgi:hypothetical protein
MLTEVQELEVMKKSIEAALLYGVAHEIEEEIDDHVLRGLYANAESKLASVNPFGDTVKFIPGFGVTEEMIQEHIRARKRNFILALYSYWRFYSDRDFPGVTADDIAELIKKLDPDFHRDMDQIETLYVKDFPKPTLVK